MVFLGGGGKLVRYRLELDEVLSLIRKLRKVIRRKIETAHSVKRLDFWVRLNGVFL